MRTESEMQSTLQMLQKTFGIDVSEAIKLNAQELEEWLKRVEDDLFNQLVTVNPNQKNFNKYT